MTLPQHKTRHARHPRRPRFASAHPDSIRIVGLGGLGEVGRNMTLLEYRGKILIIDMGLGFPEEDMPGIDFVIPNVSSLRLRKKDIVGVVFTHSHLDHIGAVPYLMPALDYPPLYATPLTRALMLKRCHEFPTLKRFDVHTVKKGAVVPIGPFNVEFFHQNHNVPDSVGLAIHTPVGTIVNTGDFKFDFHPIGDRPADLGHISRIGDRGVLLLMSDSTGAEERGRALPEREIQDNLEHIFKLAKGRLIIATFSSLLTRIQEIINLSEKYGRKVVVEGFSMRTNVEIAREMGYLQIKRDTFVPIQRGLKLPDSHVTILCTGAQGEDNAVLMRIISGDHRHLRIRAGDAVVFSSSVIPGNERAVQALKDDLYRQGARVFHYQMMDIHSGGHGKIEDLRLMMLLTRPKFFMPVHGNYSMLVSHSDLAKELAIPDSHIVIADNGELVNLNRDRIWKEKRRVVVNRVMVDGLGVGDVGNIVLRDRQTLSNDGMFVIISVIDSKTKKLRDESDIISRGFVYLKESKDLLREVRDRVRTLIDGHTTKNNTINPSYLKTLIRDELGEFLFQRTQRRPMVLPVIIEV